MLPSRLLMILATASPAAQAIEHRDVVCSAKPAPPPAGLEGWSRQRPVRAASSANTATILPIGTAVIATLLPTSAMTFVRRPEKPAGMTSSGGLFAFTVSTAGRYRVASGSGVWIDVLSGKILAVSVAHSHGPDCTGIRKIVDFDLKPGRHLLQISGGSTSGLQLLIAHLR